MTKQAFDLIHEGLTEALAVARGEAEPFRLHVPGRTRREGYPRRDWHDAEGFCVDVRIRP